MIHQRKVIISTCQGQRQEGFLLAPKAQSGTLEKGVAIWGFFSFREMRNLLVFWLQTGI